MGKGGTYRLDTVPNNSPKSILLTGQDVTGRPVNSCQQGTSPGHHGTVDSDQSCLPSVASGLHSVMVVRKVVEMGY